MLVLLQYKYVGFPQGMMLALLQWTCHIPTAFLLVLLQWTRVRFLLDFSGLAAINTRHIPTGFLLVVLQETRFRFLLDFSSLAAISTRHISTGFLRVVLQEIRFRFLLDSGWSCCKKRPSNFRWVVTASVEIHKNRISAGIIPIPLHHCDLWTGPLWFWEINMSHSHGISAGFTATSTLQTPMDFCWSCCNKNTSDFKKDLVARSCCMLTGVKFPSGRRWSCLNKVKSDFGWGHSGLVSMGTRQIPLGFCWSCCNKNTSDFHSDHAGQVPIRIMSYCNKYVSNIHKDRVWYCCDKHVKFSLGRYGSCCT